MKVIEDRQVLILDKKKSLVQDITQMVFQWVHISSGIYSFLFVR